MEQNGQKLRKKRDEVYRKVREKIQKERGKQRRVVEGKKYERAVGSRRRGRVRSEDI